jgi:hypothetical protein
MANRSPTLRLGDQTRRSWAVLSNPPDGSITPPEASKLCLQNTAVCRTKTADRIDLKPLLARNNSWDPLPLPNIVRPIAWPFPQPSLLTKDRSGSDILALDFVPSPPAGYTVKIFAVTYAGGRQVPPHFVAVAYPQDLDISQPPPFLVHFKHVPGQARPPRPGEPETRAHTLFKYFDPFGFDWLFYEIWSWLNFDVKQTGVDRYGPLYLVDMPFIIAEQSSFGLCYQLRQAKKPYVIVLPQVSRIFYANKLLDYQFYSAEVMRDVLLAIQNDILSLPADKQEALGPVAISANSSGCNVLAGFLAQNMAQIKANPVIGDFMRERLREIFILDPPENLADAEGTVQALAGWRGLASTDPAKKKCVRFYSHTFLQGFAGLAGGKQPFTKNVAGFWEDGGKTTSLAYFPFLPGGKDIWQRTHDHHIRNADKVSNFNFVHHVIPALFVTDAARRSLYV